MRQLTLLCASLCFACGPGDHGTGGPGGLADGGPGSTVEVCGNGLDDDRNGSTDEGCGCQAGQVQSCWPGDPGSRGMGACRDGVQECEGVDEFAEWGPCHDGVLPSDDVSEDGIDQDCDGDDGACQSDDVEVCDDGVDNDCDGMTDCLDFDSCVFNPQCQINCIIPLPESCGGGFDEDCDGIVDCDDPDCASDYDCSCMERCVPDQVRWCDTPSACNWGNQRCNPDGTWGTCNETSSRPSGCESSGPAYDKACCVASPNACCQDYPDNYSSVGECSGIAMCTGS